MLGVTLHDSASCYIATGNYVVSEKLSRVTSRLNNCSVRNIYTLGWRAGIEAKNTNY